MGIITAHTLCKQTNEIDYTNITEQYITNAFLGTIIVPCRYNLPTQAHFCRADSQWTAAVCTHDEIVEIFTI